MTFNHSECFNIDKINSTNAYFLGDYINAIFVDGFTCAKENIVTEWPMSHTVGNFWAMIYDFDITAVVVLNPTPNVKSSLHKRNYGNNGKTFRIHN